MKQLGASRVAFERDWRRLRASLSRELGWTPGLRSVLLSPLVGLIAGLAMGVALRRYFQGSDSDR
jgi:hypothetical protein